MWFLNTGGHKVFRDLPGDRVMVMGIVNMVAGREGSRPTRVDLPYG
jgi:hypothetical protein